MLRRAVGFAHHLFHLRHLIWAMARREIAARYVGTVGGLLWAVIQPLVTVAVYWFVFSVGFKAQGPQGTSFILYFLGGFVPWLFFQELLNACASCVVGNAHLVKKTLFPIQIMPIIHVVAAGVTHAILLTILIGLLAWQRGGIPVYALQLPYYFVAMVVFGLGLGWLVAALQVFSRDLQQGLTVVLNLWFWLTPIVWTEDLLPPGAQWLLAINPLHYIVEGYRQSLLTSQAVWQDPAAAGEYWLIAGLVLIAGATVFRRLKPEFADVL